ncbi:MAG TPA: hypothetical protein VHB53_07480 [Solirubrobacterales bacterium]|nr:hypothetical protein [Solirubrobacterales bacterium]
MELLVERRRGGALIVGPLLGAMTGSFAGVAGVGLLVVFVAGARSATSCRTGPRSKRCAGSSITKATAPGSTSSRSPSGACSRPA